MASPAMDQLMRDYAAEHAGCEVIETEAGPVLVTADTGHFRRLAYRAQEHVRRVATLERALKEVPING